MAPLDPLTRRPADPERAPTPKRPAFALLYQEHWRGVVSSLRYFGVPVRDLPDVAQDAFIRIHASLPGYDPTRPLGPWLRTITYRSARDYLKSAYSRRTRLAPAEDVETMDTAPSPERRTLIVEAERVFTDVLQDLNEDQRTAYLMSVKDGFTIPEIAEALGEPENTVRSRLHRAHVTFDAALARRRTAEERRQSALLPLLTPAALASAVREGGGADPGLENLVWSRLARVLGLGIIGKLAPLSGGAIVAGAALIAALGGVVGASLHAVIERPASETIVRAEPVARVSVPGPVGGAPGAVPSTSTSVAGAPSGGMTAPTAGSIASAAAPDAGAPDPAAQLRAETAILGRAHEAMNGGLYDVALRELNRHERIFPFGQLAEQRKEMKRAVLAELRARDAGAR